MPKPIHPPHHLLAIFTAECCSHPHGMFVSRRASSPRQAVSGLKRSLESSGYDLSEIWILRSATDMDCLWNHEEGFTDV